MIIAYNVRNIPT